MSWRLLTATLGGCLMETRRGAAGTSLSPDVMQEFDVPRNKQLEGMQLTPGSRAVANWRCARCSTSWSARVSDRHNPSTAPTAGCPRCAVKRPKLAESHPVIAADFDDVRNQKEAAVFRRVEVVPRDSDAMLWWLCPHCRTTWCESPQRRVARWERTRRSECLCCAQSRRMQLMNDGAAVVGDLELLVAELADRPSPSMDRAAVARMSIKSPMDVLWRCSTCRHEYKASIRGRACQGVRCPRCTGKVTAPENLLQVQRPDVFTELAIVQPLPRRKILALTTLDTAVLPFVCTVCLEPYRMSIRNRCLVPPESIACPKCLRSATALKDSPATVSKSSRTQRRTASTIQLASKRMMTADRTSLN